MAASCPSAAPVVMAFLLFLSAILSTGSCSGHVPLVLWSSEGSVVSRQSPPAVGQVVSAAQLESYLSVALSGTARNTLLFLQDELSVDDFTVFGGVFGNKGDSAFPYLESDLQSSSSSLTLPALSWGASSSVLPLLQKLVGAPPLYLDPPGLAQQHLSASVPALLVIRLPYKASSGLLSPREALSGNDAMIGQVLDIMRAQAVPYTAIYTALKPSREAQDSAEGVRSFGRSLLEAPEEAPEEPWAPLEFQDNETACILLWARGLQVSMFNGTWQTYDLAPHTFASNITVLNPNVTLDNSSCSANESESRLVLNYRDVLGYENFSMTFIMSWRFYPVSARDWASLDGVELDTGNETVFFNGSRFLSVPAEFSYSCASVASFGEALLLEPLSDVEPRWRLHFTDFQIQGFNIKGSKFSYASDCASFFTPGIWMGLLTSLLMLLILTYGLHMITQLRTMDRFDDPKGPSISVPQSE